MPTQVRCLRRLLFRRSGDSGRRCCFNSTSHKRCRRLRCRCPLIFLLPRAPTCVLLCAETLLFKDVKSGCGGLPDSDAASAEATRSRTSSNPKVFLDSEAEALRFPVAGLVAMGLQQLQHRGQESCGIVTCDREGQFSSLKGKEMWYFWCGCVFQPSIPCAHRMLTSWLAQEWGWWRPYVRSVSFKTCRDIWLLAMSGTSIGVSIGVSKSHQPG